MELRPGLGLRRPRRCGFRRVMKRPDLLLRRALGDPRAAANLERTATSLSLVLKTGPTSLCQSLRLFCLLSVALRSILPICRNSCAKRASHIKKTLLASEKERADVKAERNEWHTHRLPAIRAAPERLVFIDETSVKTNMTPPRGRSLKGKRLLADAPFGKWNTQTFIAGLRCHDLVAPWVIDGAINGEAFDTYVITQLAPQLKPGDVVVWDNLNVHKSPRAAEAIKARGAWVLFLPRYSPDLNPIEKAFSKLKTLLRKAKARTYDDLWKAVGKICDLFTPQECWNYFKAAQCVAN